MYSALFDVEFISPFWFQEAHMKNIYFSSASSGPKDMLRKILREQVSNSSISSYLEGAKPIFILRHEFIMSHSFIVHYKHTVWKEIMKGS